MSLKVIALIAGGVAAVPVLVVVALLIAGMRADRGVNHVEIVIRAPAEAVWRHLEDPVLVKGWVGGLVELHPLTGDGPPRVGMRDRLIVEVNGRRNELFSEITALEVNRRLEQRVTAQEGLPFVEDASFTLHPHDDGVRFAVDAKWEYTTWLGRLLEPVIAKAAQGKLEADLARLKANVER